MDRTELASWRDAYIQAQEIGSVGADHPLWWSIDKFFDLGDSDPKSCWEAILAILDVDPSEKVLGMLSAGPLEDLIHYHGPEFIDRIEHEAKFDLQFRKLLQGVWESSSPDIWERIQRARGEI